MFLSTENREPSEKWNQRHVDRMHKFKFAARKKARFFENEDICYMMMFSFQGCTLKIKATSNRIRAMEAPEKRKEFNRTMTKAELLGQENNAKKKE